MQHPLIKIIIYSSLQIFILYIISLCVKFIKKKEMIQNETNKLIFSILIQIILIISVFLPASIALNYLNSMNFSQLGINLNDQWINNILTGAFVGGSAGLLVSIFYIYCSYISFDGWNQAGYRRIVYFILQTLAYLLAVVFEEALFRGYIFQEFGRWQGQTRALLFNGFVFGGLHWLLNRNKTFWGAIGTGLAGGVLYLSYIKTNTLWMPIGIHFGWNYVIGLVFGMPISGDISPGRLLIARLKGMEYMTGGIFGPEASLPGIIAYMLIGIIIVIYL